MNKEDIEYAELKLKVPKAIIDFLKSDETNLGECIEEYLEYSIVDMVRGHLDYSLSDDRLFHNLTEAKIRELNKVLKPILGDGIHLYDEFGRRIDL